MTGRLLKERMRTVFRHLPQALGGDEEGLHQMRVAGRRLRVALPVLAKKPEGRRVRRARAALAELTRGGGDARDLDVACGLLSGHLGAPQTPVQRTLLGRLRAARGRARRRMAETLLDVEIARLRRDLRVVAGRRGEVLFTSLLRVRTARDAWGEALVAGLAALAASLDAERLHELRILARRLRYLAEVGDALRDQASGAPGLFKELQDALGSARDEHLLAAWLGRQATTAAARNQPEVAAEAERLAALFTAQSRRKIESLDAQGPAELARRALEEMGSGRSVA